MPFTYDSLAAIANAQQRGYSFQNYVAALLRTEHYDVVSQPSPANRRQVDLFASRGGRYLLVETKWRKTPSGIPDVDDLVTRLEASTGDVVGVLVSASGFSRSATERVEQHIRRPVLLVSGDELQRVERGASLHRMLDSKLEYLTVHRKAAIATTDLTARGSAGHIATTEGKHAFVTKTGERVPSLEIPGGFSDTAFCLELPELDWAAGHGVALELPLGGSDLTGLCDVFDRLKERGWITPAGTWRICQQGATWVGFGLSSLLSALENPEARYGGRTMHHSETVAYVDAAWSGIYSVTASIRHREPRRVSYLNLAFRLPGVPLDTGPIHTLLRGLDVESEPVFRPLAASFSKRQRPGNRLRTVELSAVALIVANPAMPVDQDHDGIDEWVIGAVVRNPFRGRVTDVMGVFSTHRLPDEADHPLASREDDYLVCALGQWHYRSEVKQYVIRFVDRATVGDAEISRPWLEWVDESDGSGSGGAWIPRVPRVAGIRGHVVRSIGLIRNWSDRRYAQ